MEVILPQEVLGVALDLYNRTKFVGPLIFSAEASGTGFFNILPILELTLTASMSTGQYWSNESKVES